MDTELLEKEKVSTVSEMEKKLVLHNDDHNTFDHVIECLVSICGHTALQAEQCALIVHTKGKCAVKHGTVDELIWRVEILSNEGLTVSID
jgi:ATP-dependent Clp protease adaptor protein ClpS